MGSFWLWISLTAIAGGIGSAYSVLIGGDMLTGVSVGLFIGGTLTGFEILFVQSARGAALRRLPLPAFVASVSVVWVILIAIALEGVPALIEGASGEDDGYDPSSWWRDLIFSFGVSLVLNSIIRVRALVGPRVLWNFLIGRYYRPLREERVFMFLDLAGSTRLAEEMGDVEAQTLIAQFFFDIAQPIAAHGGETHRYIGDEIVVTWPLDEATRDGRCLSCVTAIRDLVGKRADVYQARFGTVPRYRVGLHGGPVVASEVGDEKREIVYFGDTINTAARLQGLAKQRGVDVIVSRDLLERAKVPDGIAPRALEPATLAGKSGPIDVATF